MAVLISQKELTINVVRDIFTDRAKAVNSIPFKPKGGDVYLVDTNSGQNDEWLNDGYRFRQNGRCLIPNRKPVIKKTHYKLQLPDKKSGNFKKFSYELIADPGFLVVQYVGDETVAVDFPHGNSNSGTSYVPRSHSRKVKVSSEDGTLKNVQAERADKPVHCQSRNASPMSYFKSSTSTTGKIAKDNFLALHELAYALPGFIWVINTFPDLEFSFGLPFFTQILDKMSATMLSYDTTFKLGNFYLSALVCQLDAFVEKPCIPIAFLVHEHKVTSAHVHFFTELCRLLPPSFVSVIVTDGNSTVTTAIQQTFPDWTQVSCSNKIISDVEAWLKKHQHSDNEVDVYKSTVAELLQCRSHEEYSLKLLIVQGSWSSTFTEYYQTHLSARVLSAFAGHLHSLGLNMDSVTSNISESFNRVLKAHPDWHNVAVDRMVVILRDLQLTYKSQIIRSTQGFGPYTLDLSTPCTLEIDDDITGSEPGGNVAEVVNRVRQLIHGPTVQPASPSISIHGGTVTIIHVPQQQVHSVSGGDGKIPAVQLVPQTTIHRDSRENANEVRAKKKPRYAGIVYTSGDDSELCAMDAVCSVVDVDNRTSA